MGVGGRVGVLVPVGSSWSVFSAVGLLSRLDVSVEVTAGSGVFWAGVLVGALWVRWAIIVWAAWVKVRSTDWVVGMGAAVGVLQADNPNIARIINMKKGRRTKYRPFKSVIFMGTSLKEMVRCLILSTDDIINWESIFEIEKPGQALKCST